MERVKIINQNSGWSGTEYYIGENKIQNVKSVDFRVAVDEVPTFVFETNGLPEIDMPGDVKFAFIPETIQDASNILRSELSNRNSAYRQAFLSSVESVLKEMSDNDGLFLLDLSEKIVDRIAGIG